MINKQIDNTNTLAKAMWALGAIQLGYEENGQRSHKFNYWNPITYLVVCSLLIRGLIELIQEEGFLNELTSKVDPEAKRASRIRYLTYKLRQLLKK